MLTQFWNRVDLQVAANGLPESLLEIIGISSTFCSESFTLRNRQANKLADITTYYGFSSAHKFVGLGHYCRVVGIYVSLSTNSANSIIAALAALTAYKQ